MAKNSNDLSFVRGQPYAFLGQSRRIAYDYIRATYKPSELPSTFSEEDVVCYWFTKDGDDWRVALMSTFSNVYYRVTHNAHDEQTKLEVYRQFDTIIIPDKDNP
jgi:hypothetical protein